MADDICGAETISGDPCQHPAGSCPVASHSESESRGRGRPTKLDDEMLKKLIAKAEDMASDEKGNPPALPTFRALSRALPIHHQTLGEWYHKGQQHAEEGRDTIFCEFSEQLDRVRADIENDALSRKGRNSPGWVLQQLGYSPERSAHEVMGEGGGGVGLDMLDLDQIDDDTLESLRDVAVSLSEGIGD